MANKRITDLTETTSLSSNDFFAVDDASSTTRKIGYESLGAVLLLTQALVNALAEKQDTLTFDSTPTDLSTNPVTSGGIYTALSNKQDALTFDDVPTANSNNPVKSGDIYNAIGAVSTSLDSIVGNMATVETSPSLHAYTEGNYIIYNNTLFVVTTDIAIGDTLSPGNNISPVVIGDVLENKVDKEPGKGLSTNDFTNEEKEKLDNVDESLIDDIKVNGTSLPKVDKSVDIPVPERLSDLEDDSEILLENQKFLYRESPTMWDGLATIQSIKGNTVKFNQLVPPLSAMSGQNGTLSVVDNVATITSSSSVSYLGIAVSNTELPKGGHKYLLTAEVNSSKALSNCRMWYGNGIGYSQTNIPANTWNRVSGIAYNSTPTGQYVQLRGIGSFEQGDTLQVRNWNYFDLTSIFGSGNEPTSVSDFETWLSNNIGLLPYYDYTQGSLISFNGTGLKTTGKNLFNKNASFSVFNGYVGENGNIVASSAGEKAFVLKINKGEYTIIKPKTERFRIATKNDLSSGASVDHQNYNNVLTQVSFTSTINGYMFVYGLNNTGETLTVDDVLNGLQVQFANITDTSYEPYTESTLSLPILTYFPTGMKSAEDVYDELAPVKATTRIKSSDMGSLPWTMPTSGVFQAYLSDAHIRPKVLSAFFKYFTNNFTYGGASSYEDGTGGVNPNNQNIYYKDTNYTSVDALKSAMSGKYLNYELATPIETTINPPLDLTYPIWNGGTEQILPINESTPTTAPILADIGYEKVNDVVKNLISQIPNKQDLVPSAKENNISIFDNKGQVKDSGISIDLLSEVSDKTTDNEFLYRKVPVEYDGSGKITRIKGNTIKFNQLVGTDPNGLNTTNGTTISVNTNGGFNVSGTGTGNHFCEWSTTNHPDFKFITGHKYFYKFKGLKSGIIGQILSGADGVTTKYHITTGVDATGILNYTDNIYTRDTIRFYATSGYSGNTTVIMQVTDLTQIFGSGNEPATPEAFETWLSNNIGLLPYYDYTPGTLIPFKGSGLKTVGFNQWDEQWENGILNINTGNKSSNANYIRSKNFIGVIPNKTYYLNFPQGDGGVCLYDGNYNFVRGMYYAGVSDKLLTIASNEKYLMFYNKNQTYGNDICINISDTSKNGTYEQYTESTLSLEALNALFPTGMKSTGSAYDEATSNRANTRIGEVDLGTLNYNRETWTDSGITYVRFRTTISGMKAPSSGSIGADGLLMSDGKYIPRAESATRHLNYSYWKNDNSEIFIYDNAYDSASDFKTAMSGVILYYELATSTSQDVDLNLTYLIENGGTEQIIPINGSTPVTSPIIADISYSQSLVSIIKTLFAEISELRALILENIGG